MRSRTIAAAVAIAVALVVAVPSVALGGDPSDESTTTESTTTTTTEATTTTTTEAPPEPECDPSYPTLCIPPDAPDIDCPDLPPDIRNFPVVPPDPHGFDGDNDGIGCEEDGERPAPPAPAAPATPVMGEPSFTG